MSSISPSRLAPPGGFCANLPSRSAKPADAPQVQTTQAAKNRPNPALALHPPATMPVQPLAGPATVAAAAWARGSLVHVGDASVGRVVHLGQSHVAPGITDHDVALWARDSQSQIFNALLILKPKYIAMEALTFDFHGANNPEPQVQEIRKIFASWRPGLAMNALQERAMGEIGAARIYLVLTGAKTYFYRTTTEKQQERVMAFQGLHDAVDNADLVVDERETTAWAELTRFFSEHPGEEIVLIMGASHDVAKHCGENGYDPQFWCKDLSGMPAKLLQAGSKLLRDRAGIGTSNATY